MFHKCSNRDDLLGISHFSVLLKVSTYMIIIFVFLVMQQSPSRYWLPFFINAFLVGS